MRILLVSCALAAMSPAGLARQRSKKPKQDEPVLTAAQTVPVGQTPAELRFDARGDLWVACQYDTALVQLDRKERDVRTRVRLSPISPLSFHIERNGKTAVVCNFAADTLVWVDLESGETQDELQLEFRPTDLLVSTDGRKAAVACDQAQSVHFVDLVSRKSLGPPAVLNGPPHRLILDRSGRSLYAACGGDLPTLALLRFGSNEAGFWEAPLLNKGPLALSKDGKVVFAAAADGGLLLLDAAGGGQDPGAMDVVLERKPMTEKVHDCVLLADGEHLVLLLGLDSEIAVLDLEEWTITERLPTGKSPARLALFPDGRTLAVANRSDGTVSFYDVRK